MSKSFNELIEQSKSVYLNPHKIENFINEEELAVCLKIFDELPVFEPASHARATRKDYLIYSETDSRIKDIFLSKLQDLFPDKKIVVDGGNFTLWHRPVGLHSDGYQFAYKNVDAIVRNRQALGFAVLIPLSTDTGIGTPKTVFFNQTRFGEECSHAIDPDAMKTGKGIDKFTHREFNIDDYESMDHIPVEKLYGFSVEQVIPWSIKSAIIWHRAQFHCASNFVNYKNKLHLIFFINFE
jgi:hypothetical protein